MRRCFMYMILIVASPVAIFCSPERKSSSYYQQNKAAISELRSSFNYLYKQQPFAAGFTDKSFRYYVMQVMTDSLRAIYNDEKNKDEIVKNIRRYNYDTTRLLKLASQMKAIKCLWLGRESYYIDEDRSYFTYISFQSADKAFKENKYFILVFFDHLNYSDADERIRKRKLVKLDSLVYFTTTNRYR